MSTRYLLGLRRYVGAIAVNLLALMLGILLQPRLESGTFVVLLMAVMYSSWYGGRLAGLIAVAFATWTQNYLLLSPSGELSVTDSLDVLRTAVFVVVALLVSSVNSARSAQRRAEESRALAERQRGWLDAVLDVMPVPLLLLSPDSREVITANRAARAHAGGSYPLELLQQAGLPRLPGVQETPQQAAGTGPIQARWETPAGTRHLLIDAHLLPATLGFPATLVVPYQDVTALREAEEALRQSESRYRALAESAPIGIFHTDALGAILYVNEAGCELAGLDPEQVLGDGWLTAVHPDDREKVLAAWARTRDEGAPFELEFRLQQPGGGVTSAACRAVPLPGEPGGFVGVVADVTAEREAQAALRRLAEQRSALIATVSHALRAPLTAALANLEVIEDGTLGALSPDQQASMLRAIESLLSLQATVDDLLALSELREGRARPRVEPVDLCTLLREVAERMATRAAQRNVALVLEPLPNLGSVDTDRRRLRELVTELLENGVKYCRQGGSVRLGALTTPAGVEIRVCDQGPGFSQEDLPHVFDPFYRGVAAREEQVRGSGLGLTLARETANLLGFGIAILPGQEGGACLSVTIPGVLVNAATPPAPPTPLGNTDPASRCAIAAP